MTIISISINDKILQEIDRLSEELGFSGRSEIIRTAIRLLISEGKEKTKLKGIIDAILLVIHDDKYTKTISDIQHDYYDIIKTQLHNHLENHKCFDIFLLNGDAKKIVRLSEDFQTSKKTDTVKLIVS